MSDERETPPVLILKAVCCREWDILAGAWWGRCGYCGTRPVIVS